MHRRAFIKHGGTLALGAVAAFGFGCSIKTLVGKSDRIVLIYGTRYGSTRETAYWIAKGIGLAVDVVDIEAIDTGVIDSYDKVIIGSGIWIDGPHKALTALLETHQAMMAEKVIASFVVCGTVGEDAAGSKRIESYLSRLHQPLGTVPPLHAHFGGRMIIEELSDIDRKLLENFYRNILKREFVSWDRTDPLKAERYGMQIRS